MVRILLAACLLSGCATVRQQDLSAWKDVPVEKLDTHTLFLTLPVYKTISSEGVEIRNYVNSGEVANCFSNGLANKKYTNYSTFTTCSNNTVACNNIFFIRDGKVIKYSPTGSCYTDDSVRPQPN